jgi:hypothetical protein
MTPFFYVFGRFSVRGVQKHDKNVLAKSSCRKLFPRKFSENRQNFRYQLFLDFFCFIAFSGVSWRWEFKNTTKKFYKKIVSKSFKKNRPKIQNRLFLDFLNHVFGRFSVRGVQKHDKKSQKNPTSPGTFLASEEPTNHVGLPGGRRRFFSR